MGFARRFVLLKRGVGGVILYALFADYFVQMMLKNISSEKLRKLLVRDAELSTYCTTSLLHLLSLLPGSPSEHTYRALIWELKLTE